MLKRSGKVYLSGNTGLLGSSALRLLKDRGFKNILVRNHKRLDLTRQLDVEKFFKNERPAYCFMAAAKVGGILANRTLTGQFIYDNLMIEANIINAAYISGVKKLLFYASACSYPVDSRQPMKEEYFLTGRPEHTNISYAVAKIAGITLCQAYRAQYGCNFICAVPTNAYGPRDNFDLKDAHVIPALIRRFHDAKIKGDKKIILWGTGKPKREFIYSDDVANASLFLMDHYNSPDIINIGSGCEISVKDLSNLVKDVIGYRGSIAFDRTKPDGASRKLLDSTRINRLGWRARVSIEEGIKKTYDWFIKEYHANEV